MKVRLEPHDAETMEVTISVTLDVCQWRHVEDVLRRNGTYAPGNFAKGIRESLGQFFDRIDNEFEANLDD